MSRESIEDLLAQRPRDARAGRHAHQRRGGQQRQPYFEVKDEDWDRVLDSNLKAVHWGCQVFGKQMAEAGRRVDPEHRERLGAPAALAGLRLLGLEGGRGQPDAERRPRAGPAGRPGQRPLPRLLPGRAEPQDPRPRSGSRRSCANTPMARFGEPHELVGATLLMLSRKAGSFITGATYYVDGGFTAMRL